MDARLGCGRLREGMPILCLELIMQPWHINLFASLCLCAVLSRACEQVYACGLKHFRLLLAGCKATEGHSEQADAREL